MAIVETVAKLIAKRRGAALFIDYGNDHAAATSIRVCVLPLF